MKNWSADEHITTGRTFQNKTPCSLCLSLSPLIALYLILFTNSTLLDLLLIKPSPPAEEPLSESWCRPNLTSCVFLPRFLILAHNSTHLIAAISFYKINIKKNKNLQVNLYLWSRYKKQHFNTQDKTRDETFPRLLPSSSYSEGAFSSSSIFQSDALHHKLQTEFSREGAHVFQSLTARASGRVVFPSSDSWAVALTVPAGSCLGGNTCILC